jgi:nucleoside-diphosphate-sugar epimerase
MRAFIHVRDFARAFLFALDNADRMAGQVYNLGGERLNLTKGDLARRMQEKLDFALQISESGEDPDRRDYRVDFSKLRALGFEAEVGLEEGIEELVRAYKILEVQNPYSNVAHV